MTTTSRDRISVGLRGLKATLFERARASGVSPSGLLRDIVVEALGSADAGAGGLVKTAVPMPSGVRVRLTLRMNRNEAVAVIAAARLAGLTPGAYVAGMLAGVPVLTLGGDRPDHIATLTASNAELSTLSRNIYHLTSLLRQGAVRPAQAYRSMLDTLVGEVRVHLKLASGVLADLQPQRSQAAKLVKHPTT